MTEGVCIMASMKEDRGELDLTRQVEELKKRVQEAEGETTIVKGIGMNSPEMKALQKEVEELKTDLARAKEDHQFDNLVHQKELESLRKK